MERDPEYTSPVLIFNIATRSVKTYLLRSGSVRNKLRNERINIFTDSQAAGLVWEYRKELRTDRQ